MQSFVFTNLILIAPRSARNNISTGFGLQVFCYCPTAFSHHRSFHWQLEETARVPTATSNISLCWLEFPMILLCYLPAISLQKQSVGWRINLTAGFIPQGCIYYCHTTPWWCSGWLKYKMFNYSEFQFPFKGRDILLTNWRVFSRLVIILVRRFSTSKPVSTPQDACASMTALVVILWLNLRSNFTVIHSKSSN